MLDNTIKKLSFLVELSKLDSNIYENIKAVVPEIKSQNSILILTPQGKSDIAISYVVNLINQMLQIKYFRKFCLQLGASLHK